MFLKLKFFILSDMSRYLPFYVLLLIVSPFLLVF
jgi:hypothetical protein